MKNKMEITITKELLRRLCVNESCKAYPYMLSVMELTCKDPDCLQHITKSVYIDIARMYNTSDVNVERGIRKTIERAWEDTNKDKELVIQLFGEKSISRRPSNTVFFRGIYGYVCQLRGLLTEQCCVYCKCDSCVQKVMNSLYKGGES